MVSEGREWEEQVGWAGRNGADHVLEDQIREMSRITARVGAGFVLTRFTHGQEVDQETILAELARRIAVDFVRIDAAFSGRAEETMARLADGTYDPHYGPEGTRRFAEALLPALEEKLRRGSDRRGVLETAAVLLALQATPPGRSCLRNYLR